MAAGLGFKTFTTGEVLTAADTNGYLMQGVLVFASAAARDAAITSPQEGQFAYLKDTNVTTYYTGSAWTNLDTTGMTNPMTTTGDMVYSSSGSTPARLGIGTTGQVITVAGGIPSWATPASAGGVLGSAIRTESAAISTTSSSLVAMDTTNLRVTFTAPASGTVIILWRAYMYSVTGTNKVGILESATTKVTGVPTGNGTADWVGANGIFKITGISAGSHTYDLAYLNTGGTAGVYGDSVQNSAMVVMAG